MRLSRNVLVVGLIAASGCVHLPLQLTDKPEASVSALRGTWVAVDPGDATDALLPAGCRLVITDSRFDILSSVGVVAAPGTYSADFQRFPHPIDVVTTVRSSDGKPVAVHQAVVLGIVKVEGDTLTLCLDATAGPKVRPRRFATAGEKMFEDRGRTFLQAVFRRETPAAAPKSMQNTTVEVPRAETSKIPTPTPVSDAGPNHPEPIVPNDGWKPRRSNTSSLPRLEPTTNDMPPMVDGRELLPTMPTME